MSGDLCSNFKNIIKESKEIRGDLLNKLNFETITFNKLYFMLLCGYVTAQS